MQVTDLQGAKLYVPYEKLEKNTITEVKYRLLDSIISFIGGALSLPGNDLKALCNTLDRVSDIRPVYPTGLKTSLEMAGFLNAYILRSADWGDTYRRKDGIFGHPSDQVAAILALCDNTKVSGKKVIELTHLAYQLFALLGEYMPGLRQPWDYTSALSLNIPVLSGICFNDSPEKIQNALNLSASGGAVLHQVRTNEVTNLKSGASAYAIARGFWCHRISGAITAPGGMFEGEDGWYKTIAPLEGELIGPGRDITYTPVEVKTFPCFHVGQASVECASSLHQKLKGDIDNINQIIIHVSKVYSKRIIRTNQHRYPESQPDADHHLKYCVATSLQYGALTPLHYNSKYLQDNKTRRIIDIIEIKVLTNNELTELGRQDDACILQIFMDNGSLVQDSRTKAKGSFFGLDTEKRLIQLREIIEKKQQMLEEISGINLAPVSKLVSELENHSGCNLLDKIQESFLENIY